MIANAMEVACQPRAHLRAGALILLAVVVAATGCASTRATAKRYGRDSSLLLDDPAAWSRFEVRRTSFVKRISFADLAGGERWESKYEGTPVSWITPAGVLIPEKVYDRRAHRGRFRLEHPFSRQPVVVRARATSQSVGTVPLPTRGAAPVIEILDGDERQVQGSLAYDLQSLVLFTGRIGEHEVAIEQLDAGARRPGNNPLEYLVTPFPAAGEFVVRLDDRVAARFLKRMPRGTVAAYELALRGELSTAERDAAALAFMVFVLMEEFVHSAVS